MSGTTTELRPPIMTPMMLGAIAVSLANSLAFLTALIIAYINHDTASLGQLIGAVIANATTVVSFWLGSSAGSARKTDIIAAATRPPNPPAASAPSP